MAVLDEDLKQQLVEERTRLQDQLSRLEEVDHHGAGYGNHIADDASETLEQVVGVSLQRNETSLLWQVEHALTKFSQGVYGLCEACGAPIERARLKVLPYVVYCLDCQARAERGG